MSLLDDTTPDHPEMEQRLWEYIDGHCSEAEKKMVGDLIANQSEWKSTYQLLLQTQQVLQSTELEAPSMRFTRNVMEEIAKFHIAPATKSYINKNVIRGLAFFFLAMILGAVIFSFGLVDWKSQPGQSTSSFFSFQWSKIDYSQLFNNTYINAFLLVNVILLLFLTDRYLSNKRKNRELAEPE